MSPEDSKRFNIIEFPPTWDNYDDVNACIALSGPVNIEQIKEWLDRHKDDDVQIEEKN